ncbi:MAG: ABC transporter ATP-binding protein [Bacteroidota bacterium]
MSDTPLLHVRDLTQTIGSRFRRETVLHGIDLDVRAGEFVTLVGPSGSGKSTLLHVLGLLDLPTSGTYILNGNDTTRLSAKQRTTLARDTIAFVFQAYHLIDDLTVAENIEEPLRYKGLKTDERRQRVSQVLERFELAAKADRYPTELSGGQQQLVGVSRALAMRPRLLLADEPTGNLHSSQGERVMDALAEVHAEGVTILHVTHSERWAERGHRTVELLDGRIVSDTPISS